MLLTSPVTRLIKLVPLVLELLREFDIFEDIKPAASRSFTPPGSHESLTAVD
jgi:hypothetical protein